VEAKTGCIYGVPNPCNDHFAESKTKKKNIFILYGGSIDNNLPKGLLAKLDLAKSKKSYAIINCQLLIKNFCQAQLFSLVL